MEEHKVSGGIKASCTCFLSWEGALAPRPCVRRHHIPRDHGITSLVEVSFIEHCVCCRWVTHSTGTVLAVWDPGMATFPTAWWQDLHCRQRGWIPSELPSRAALLATSSSSTNSCHCNLLVKNRQNAFSSKKKKSSFLPSSSSKAL